MTRSEGAGDRFQRQTVYARDREPREPASVPRRPPPHKAYRKATTIQLPRPAVREGAPLWRTMHARRSVRDYGRKPVTGAELSQLLWAAQGVTAAGTRQGRRTAPSAGALYPLETYVAVHTVADIEPGVYHYGVERHELELIRPGCVGAELERAALGQSIAREAGVVFIWSAIFDRCKWKYGQRAYRYIYLDAGHLAQNLALAAVALGLGSCPIAAFFDPEMNAILDINGESESVIYMTTVGRTTTGRRSS